MTRKKSPTIKNDLKTPYCVRIRPSMLVLLNKASANAGVSKSLIIENGTGKEIKRLFYMF